MLNKKTKSRVPTGDAERRRDYPAGLIIGGGRLNQLKIENNKSKKPTGRKPGRKKQTGACPGNQRPTGQQPGNMKRRELIKMYKDYRYINAGENEIYRWGHKAQDKVRAWMEPNEHGYYSIPCDGGKYWTIGTSTGKYGEFCKALGVEPTIFSVNSAGFAYAKAGTEKGEKFIKFLQSMIDFMIALGIKKAAARRDDDDDDESEVITGEDCYFIFAE